MKKQIIALLIAVGQSKIEFKPEIRISAEGTNTVLWVQDIYELKGRFMVSVSTMVDSGKRNLDNVDEMILKGIRARLKLMYAKSEVHAQLLASWDEQVNATIVEPAF